MGCSGQAVPVVGAPDVCGAGRSMTEAAVGFICGVNCSGKCSWSAGGHKAEDAGRTQGRGEEKDGTGVVSV